MSEKAISSTTQEFLDVYDIVNDMVLLKDGTASIVMQVGTMNFSLLAEQEQDAIIFTYGSLLNSLNYPIQISIQSQTKDVTKYLRLLDEQVQKASSDRKALLIKQYRNFVAALIKERNVLEKHFYITVPASPAEMGLITPSSVLPGKTAFDISTIEKSILLEKAINILEPRRDHLTAQFNRLGLQTRQLNTQEIIQNFYINYNPEAAEGQEISNNENYTTPLVRASFGGKIMQTNNQVQNAAPNNVAETNSTSNHSQNPTPEEILRNEPVINQAPVQPAQQTQQIETAQTDQIPIQESNQTQPSEQMGTPGAEIPETMDMSATSVDSTNTAQIELNPPQMPVEPLTQTEQLTQTAPLAQTALPTEVTQPTKITPPAQATEVMSETPTSVNLDLNLDPSLINNGQANPAIEQNLTEPPIANSIPQEESQNNFTEEITPLQNKLEQSVANNTSQISEENTLNQAQA